MRTPTSPATLAASSASIRGRRLVASPAPATTFQAGFTLIELLAVVAIVAVLFALSVPLLGRVSNSMSLTTSGQMVGDMLALARQEAVSRNCEVQVLFIRFPGDDRWRGIQIRRIEMTSSGPTPVPVTRLSTLPAPIVLVPGATSPLMTADAVVSGTLTLPNTASPATYTGFRFRANGSTGSTITAATNFLTLCSERDLKTSSPSAGQLPANYFSLQINPITGKVSAYRP